MDFRPSEEQREVAALSQKVLGDYCGNERLRQIEDSAETGRFDGELWQALAELGLLGVAVSEADGGMGFGFEELSALIEQSGRHVAPVPLLQVLVGGAMPLSRFGSEEQRARLLPGILGGDAERLVVPAMHDPMPAGSAVRPELRAVASADGWQLDGELFGVPLAKRAVRVLVPASTGDGDEQALFLLDPAAAGVSITEQLITTGESYPKLELQGVRVAPEDVLAQGDQARAATAWIAERMTAALAVQALGIADQMTKMTAEYTAEREQFGVKIATFQAVGQRAANCYIDVQCLSVAVMQAVSLLARETDATDAVRVAKVWAGDACHRISYAAQHMHGGMGVDRDYHLWRYCLWAKKVEMLMGSSVEQLQAIGSDLAEKWLAELR